MNLRARSAPIVLACFAVACTAAKPPILGIVDGKLAPCPSAPHCVSSQERGSRHAAEAAPYRSTREEARQRLIEILRGTPGYTILTDASDYIHAEYTTPRFHWKDDVEIYLDDRAKLVQFRSSSRSGYYDFGANRRRIAKLRAAFLGAKS